MRKAIFLLAAFIVILVSAQAMLAGERFQASLNFLLANAQNDFRMNVGRTFYGLSGEFFYQLPKSPVSFGVSLEYLEYGSETRVEPFSHDIPDVLVDVTTRNSVLTPAAVVRFSPVEGLIRPYVEVLAGFNYMFTYTSVHDDSGWSGDIATTTNFDDWTFTYGAGAGVVVRALDVRSQQGRTLFSLQMEVGLRYSKGNTAEYLTEGSTRTGPGHYHSEPLVSSTDLLKARFGLVFRF